MKYTCVSRLLLVAVGWCFFGLCLCGCHGETAQDWATRLYAIRWVDYSPSSWNPDQGIEPSSESIRQDLSVLRKAQFTGLVTYSAKGKLGNELLTIAKETGFQGVIVGIWDPANSDEVAAAKRSATSAIVFGFCVGNEGLMEHRYSLDALEKAIRDIRETTKKPVTTTEIIQRYDSSLLTFVDWAFPNAHPYFAGILEPDRAVTWTRDAYAGLKGRTSMPVLLKEVGLPTAGDSKQSLSEQAQCEYYDGLAKTDAHFVYFEAFDQRWKTHLSVEPHWGIYRSDGSPKLLAQHLAGSLPCLAASPLQSATPSDPGAFFVYKDKDDPSNRFTGPRDYMGDIGDIKVVEGWDQNPHSGATSVKFEYSGKGTNPKCDYQGSCGWAGVYWLEPTGNWGTNKNWTGAGQNLSGYKKLKFWARADGPATIEFKVGGVIGPYDRDSLRPARTTTQKLTGVWTEFTIDLEGADLKNTIGGFGWSATKEDNPHGAVFYVDDVRFEH